MASDRDLACLKARMVRAATLPAGDRPDTWRATEAWLKARGLHLMDMQRDAPRGIYAPHDDVRSTKWRNLPSAATRALRGVAVREGADIVVWLEVTDGE